MGETKANPMGLVAQAVSGAWHEFKSNEYRDTVECVTTSNAVEFDPGVFCIVQVSVKFIPTSREQTVQCAS